MDPISAGINFLGSLITTDEEAKTFDLKNRQLDSAQADRALAAQRLQVEQNSLSVQAQLQAQRLEAEQKNTLLLAGAGVIGVGIIALVIVMAGQK